MPPGETARFSALYRAACADLALADAYQLPQNTVQYLHRLVGRAHNQLYRSRRFDVAAWSRMLLRDVPQQIFGDRCVQFAFVLFWSLFGLSAWLSYDKQAWPEYAETVLGHEAIEMLEARGIPLDMLRVRAFPFHQDVSDFIAEHDAVFLVEQNRDAQMRTLIVNECEVDPLRVVPILHYDGTPITARFIARAIGDHLDALKVTPMRKVVS